MTAPAGDGREDIGEAEVRDDVRGAELPDQGRELLAVSVRSEDGTTVDWPSVPGLYRLLDRIGAEGDTFLVVERIPDDEQYYVQTRRDEGEPYVVEYREGSAKTHFQADVESTADVLAVFVGWARGEEGWKGAHNWRRLRL
ncbi:hypothetical protein [Streptodolium elevatio]|uniref:Uncharacterized protein n=1 Tax=Streptodolium elevatio TaxID=3157996 RepID=A0ABV3DFR7_9ACTN